MSKQKGVEQITQKDKKSYLSDRDAWIKDGANIRKDWQTVGVYLRYAVNEGERK